MNQKQYERVLEIIEQDCELRFDYVDKEGRTCVVGALALAAGYDESLLHEHHRVRIDNESLVSLRKDIYKVFGLTKRHLVRLQDLNDIYEDSESRRLGIKAALPNILHRAEA